MTKSKTAYPEEWEKDFNWLTKCKKNISKAYCTICKLSFKKITLDLLRSELMLVLMVIKTK